MPGAQTAQREETAGACSAAGAGSSWRTVGAGQAGAGTEDGRLGSRRAELRAQGRLTELQALGQQSARSTRGFSQESSPPAPLATRSRAALPSRVKTANQNQRKRSRRHSPGVTGQPCPQAAVRALSRFPRHREAASAEQRRPHRAKRGSQRKGPATATSECGHENRTQTGCVSTPPPGGRPGRQVT